MKNDICIRLEADAKQIMNCREVVQKLDTSFQDLSSILSLTGNSVRLKLLYLLNKEGRLCVCDLSDVLEMNVSAISQHLRKLKDRNLIYFKKEAQTIFYSISEDKLTLLTPFFEILDNSKVLEDTEL
jgi:DNA-binding transcriptional ArsR family regulator